MAGNKIICYIFCTTNPLLFLGRVIIPKKKKGKEKNTTSHIKLKSHQEEKECLITCNYQGIRNII